MVRTRSSSGGSAGSSSYQSTGDVSPTKLESLVEIPSTRKPTLHREDFISDIVCLLQAQAPMLYVTGPVCSGKWSSVRGAVEECVHQGITVVTVDMRDILKVQAFYVDILQQLCSETVSIDHTNEFIRALNATLSEPVVLVLKEAHRLNDLNPLLFATVCRLNELTGGLVSVVMVTCLSWDLLYSGTGLPKPLIINIPAYDRQQMLDIMQESLVHEYSDNTSKQYVKAVYDTLHPYTSSLSEMLLICSRLLTEYLAPLRSGDLTESEGVKLWRAIQPKLAHTTTVLGCVSAKMGHVELPHTSRVLLVSAFLASHNPARLDKRFFCKGKSSRKKVKTRTSTKLSEALKGPKTFPLERLMAIHASILQDGSIPSADILIAVSSLVSLNLIVRMSNDLLEQPKFKCIVPLHVIRTIAKESNVDIERFYFNYS